MKMFAVALLALSILSACASQKKTEAPAKTETPATMGATTPTAADSAKKETKPATKAKTAQEAASVSEVTCKGGSDERKLEIQPKDSGCELLYTKAGETKAIASQIIGNAKCEEVMTSIKEKLVAADFACQ